ncbi:MAG TPA: M50 family metallopeptidase, partial [Bacteroidales bacterium]|nr:M50 family metallopeptidase [Bacteroidales bacterium]
FRSGDRILAFDDKSVVDDPVHMLHVDLVRTRPAVITVLRGEDTVRFNFDQNYIAEMLNVPGLFSIRYPFVVSSVPDSSLNIGAGLMAGDRIVSVNGLPAPAIQDVQKVLAENKGGVIEAGVQRDGESISVSLLVNEQGMLMVGVTNPMDFIPVTIRNYSLPGAFPAGIDKAYKTASNYLKELGLIFNPKTKAYKSVGSFIAIGSIFPGTWNWEVFWNITAWLSVMLAVLNLLPIPALDGGHIVLVLYEMISRKKPSDKFLEYSQIVGMIILMGLMFLAFGNDILRLFT